MSKIRSSEIIPEHLYLSRRRFLTGAGAVAAGAFLSACGIQAPTASPPADTSTPQAGAAGTLFAGTWCTAPLLPARVQVVPK